MKRRKQNTLVRIAQPMCFGTPPFDVLGVGATQVRLASAHTELVYELVYNFRLGAQIAIEPDLHCGVGSSSEIAVRTRRTVTVLNRTITNGLITNGLFTAHNAQTTVLTKAPEVVGCFA